MYHKYNINLIYRFIGFLLFSLMIAFIDSVYLLTILTLLFIYLNNKGNPLMLILEIITVFFLICRYIDNNVLMINIMLVIDYGFWFSIHITKDELISTKRIIFDKYYRFDELASDYATLVSDQNNEIIDKYISEDCFSDDEEVINIKSRLVEKNTEDINNKLIMNYLRFYKNKNDIIDNWSINSDAIVYLGVHVIFLIIAILVKL